MQCKARSWRRVLELAETGLDARRNWHGPFSAERNHRVR